jgi:hypothetical protein
MASTDSAPETGPDNVPVHTTGRRPASIRPLAAFLLGAAGVIAVTAGFLRLVQARNQPALVATDLQVASRPSAPQSDADGGAADDSAASQPAFLEGETVLAAWRRLSKITANSRKEQVALRTAIEMCLALGRADGKRAVERFEVIGYQTLPLEGDLPEPPDRPAPADTIKAQLDKRAKSPIDHLPAEMFQIRPKDKLREQFPAAAAWMLADDVAIVISPTTEPGGDWLTRPGCLIIRVRAGKPAVIGGNLLEALK